MLAVLALLLLPMCFTAPADSLGNDRTGKAQLSLSPVQSYLFHRLDPTGELVPVPGYADSLGLTVLRPHRPGTRETVWLSPGPTGERVRIFVTSRDQRGNLSPQSNGCWIGGGATTAAFEARPRPATRASLDVPAIRQVRERCGQAALTMVFRYYGAPPAAYHEVDAAFDPVLHGSLITDLAGAATRAGYEATVATLTPERLIELLENGVPPILLYQSGTGPITYPHFGVVTAWDPGHSSFTLNDGSSRPFVARREDLEKRWVTAGSQALVVRQRQP